MYGSYESKLLEQILAELKAIREEMKPVKINWPSVPPTFSPTFPPGNIWCNTDDTAIAYGKH